jgi:nucleoside-diphosphate-sugar epimerase
VQVVVTGGSGFLGRQLVPRLVASGLDVVAVSHRPAAFELLEAMGAEPVRADLADSNAVAEVFDAAPGAVLVDLVSLGLGHARMVTSAAQRAGLQRAVFLATAGILTTRDASARSDRLAAERTIRASTLDWTIVRPTMMYGRPGDRNLERLVHLVRRSPIVPLPGGGRGLHQPVHVDDVAAGIERCVERDVSIGCAFVLAGPQPISLRDLVRTTAAEVGRKVHLVPVPLRPAIVGTRWYERRSASPRLRAAQVSRLGEDKAFDISSARRALAYEPRSFADGIRQEVALVP